MISKVQSVRETKLCYLFYQGTTLFKRKTLNEGTKTGKVSWGQDYELQPSLSTWKSELLYTGIEPAHLSGRTPAI